MARVRVDGVEDLIRSLGLVEKRISANAFKATARKEARKVVVAAREELGKQGNHPDQEQVWRAIGVKSLRNRPDSIGVMVHVRGDSKFDGDKLTAPGAAKLIEKGAYKNPERVGRDGKTRGNIQKFSKGDFIEKGFDKVKTSIESGFDREYQKQLSKRL